MYIGCFSQKRPYLHLNIYFISYDMKNVHDAIWIIVSISGYKYWEKLIFFVRVFSRSGIFQPGRIFLCCISYNECRNAFKYIWIVTFTWLWKSIMWWNYCWLTSTNYAIRRVFWNSWLMLINTLNIYNASMFTYHSIGHLQGHLKYISSIYFLEIEKNTRTKKYRLSRKKVQETLVDRKVCFVQNIQTSTTF